MSVLADLEGILSDPSTDAEIISAVLTVAEQIIAKIRAHDAGDMTASQAAAAITGIIASDAAADADADKAGQDAIDKRFPTGSP